MLKLLGIYQGLPPEYIKQKFSVVLARTLRELNGEQCLEIEDIQPTKKQIMVSRALRIRLMTSLRYMQ